MPLPVIADVFRVTWDWSCAGVTGNAANVMHFSAPTHDESDVFDAIVANATTAMFDWVTDDAFVNNIDVLALDGVSATHSNPLSPPLANLSGGGLGTGCPQVAGLIKLQTGLRGRENRGRIFLPYVGSQEFSTEELIDVAAVQAAWVAFANDMDTDGVSLGVASYKNANWHQALAVVAEPTIATQRRRNKRP